MICAPSASRMSCEQLHRSSRAYRHESRGFDGTVRGVNTGLTGRASLGLNCEGQSHKRLWYRLFLKFRAGRGSLGSIKLATARLDPPTTPPAPTRCKNTRRGHRGSMITRRRRKKECPKDLKCRQKNHKAYEPPSMRRSSIQHRRAAEQHSHLQRKRCTAIIPQSESHLAHAVIKRKIRPVHDQIENPMGKDCRSQNQTSTNAAKARHHLADDIRQRRPAQHAQQDCACKACNTDRARWKR